MAIVGRISTYAVFQNTWRNISNTQSSVFNLQGQLSSGLKADSFAGLTGQVEQFTQLNAKISKTKTYEENNAVGISRLQTTNTALNQIIEIADDIEDLMVLRRNPTMANNMAFEQQIKAKMDALAAELNTTFEGRFLFGGTKTNVNPVIVDPKTPGPVTVGRLDANYYQGSEEDLTLRAADNVDIKYNVRADNEAFQKLFGGIALALQGHTENSDAILKQAIDMIQEGQADLNAVQASVNTNIVTLQDQNTRHEALRLYWKGVTEEVSKTDILAASTQLAVDQTVLQASFQAFAQINRLRLTDYL